MFKKSLKINFLNRKKQEDGNHLVGTIYLVVKFDSYRVLTNINKILFQINSKVQ